MSRKLKPKPKLAGPKKQPPRWKRDKSISLYLWIIIPIIIALAVGLVGYWGYTSHVSAWNQTVVKINDTDLNMSYYVKMLRFYSYVSRILVTDASLPEQVMVAIIENELIKQEAEELNIEVTADEITAVINASLLTEQEAEGNVTLSQSELSNRYQSRLDQSGLSNDEYRDFVNTVIRGEKIQIYLKDTTVPSASEQVYLHLIVLADEETAGNVTRLLEQGRDFGNLSAEYSVIESLREERGDMGWIPKGVYTELDDVIFSLEVGNISEPFQSGQGYYIAKVSAKADNMEIPDEYRGILATMEFNSWLNSAKETSIIEVYLDDDQVAWAVSQAQK
ncbi:MAG TPA: hypothetical protein G4O13_04310 [Dehalococcoidia bacterium]|nr:hypothetical protein [Dehalococcoidia bacterium]